MGDADLPPLSVKKIAQLAEAYNLQDKKLLNNNKKAAAKLKQLHLSLQDNINRLNNQMRPVPPAASARPRFACAGCHSIRLFAYAPLRE